MLFVSQGRPFDQGVEKGCQACGNNPGVEMMSLAMFFDKAGVNNIFHAVVDSGPVQDKLREFGCEGGIGKVAGHLVARGLAGFAGIACVPNQCRCQDTM